MGLSMRTVMPIVAAAGLIATAATSAVAAPAPVHRHAMPSPAVRVHGMTKVTGVTLPHTSPSTRWPRSLRWSTAS
jgi:hypothetical protein